MIAFVTSWVTRKAWPYLVAGAGLALIIFQVKRNGRLQEKLDQSEHTVRKIEGMRDAVANTPTDRTSVSRRMRNGGF